MAKENSGWGYDRIVGALANLGHVVSDQTVGNILRRHGIAPAPKRSQSTTWKDFIAAHMAVLAGIDFFTVEVLTWRGLATYYVLFFIHLESRRVTLGGITKHPTEEWMLQMGRNATDESSGFLKECRYVLHDRDTKFSASFRQTLTAAGVEPLKLPPRSPNLNAFAERWVRSVKQECLSKLILFGEGSLKRALTEFGQHYHAERPHQGKDNVVLFPTGDETKHLQRTGLSVAKKGSAAYSDTTAAPREYFDQTTCRQRHRATAQCLPGSTFVNRAVARAHTCAAPA